jgi:hypothetical protein
MVCGVGPVDVVAAVGVFGRVNMADPEEEKSDLDETNSSALWWAA